MEPPSTIVLEIAKVPLAVSVVFISDTGRVTWSSTVKVARVLSPLMPTLLLVDENTGAPHAIPGVAGSAEAASSLRVTVVPLGKVGMYGAVLPTVTVSFVGFSGASQPG